MGTLLVSSPNQIFQEDTQGGAAVSEAILGKYGQTNNYILDYFDRYDFGVTGGVFSGLALPYTFSGNIENMRTAYSIVKVVGFLEIGGTAGTTSFKVERQLAAGGAWSNILAGTIDILHSAADGVFFDTSVAAPAGVTLQTIAIPTLAVNDKLRFVLTASATVAQNLSITVFTRPTI